MKQYIKAFTFALILAFFSQNISYAISNDYSSLALKVANLLTAQTAYEIKGDKKKAQEIGKQIRLLSTTEEFKSLHKEADDAMETAKIDPEKGKVLFKNVADFFKALYEDLEKINKKEAAKKYKLSSSQIKKLNVAQQMCCLKCLAQYLGFKNA